MSDIANSSEELKSAVLRFDKSLTNLENCLGQAVAKIAELGRSTGYADAKAEAAQNNADDGANAELVAAKAREAELEDAVKHARTALNEAIEDIRTVLGPV